MLTKEELFEKKKKKRTFLGLAISLMRSNGLFVSSFIFFFILLPFVFLFFFKKKKKKKKINKQLKT
jgi:predicted PurR-regulated permease PerM